VVARKLSKLTRVLIVDDETIFRDGLFALIAANPGYETVETVDDISASFQAVRDSKPHIVILDPNRAGDDGIRALTKIRTGYPDARLLVLSKTAENDQLHRAFSAGADGYVLKDDSRTELFTALQYLSNGEPYVSPIVCRQLIDCFVNAWHAQKKLSAPNVLTPREQQVIRLIAQGRRTREIAEHYSLSPKTVDKHRTNLMKKLNLHSISAVTVYAMEHGLVEDPE
jgi:DNA-binding NarL/FixJ family response regulator